MVLIGVFGECGDLIVKKYSEHWHKKYESRLEWIELLFGIIVVFGLAWEFREISKSDEKAAELNRQAEQFRAKADELEKQMADAKTNIEKLDWNIRPIFSLRGYARILVKPLGQVDDLSSISNVPPDDDWQYRLPGSGNGKAVTLTLGRAGPMATNIFDLKQLQVDSDNVTRFFLADASGKRSAICFNVFFDGTPNKFFDANLSPSELSSVELKLSFPFKTFGGAIDISLDAGLTNFTFKIPPQNSIGWMVSSFESNGVFMPLKFSADMLQSAPIPPSDTNTDFLYLHP